MRKWSWLGSKRNAESAPEETSAGGGEAAAAQFALWRSNVAFGGDRLYRGATLPNTVGLLGLAVERQEREQRQVSCGCGNWH